MGAWPRRRSALVRGPFRYRAKSCVAGHPIYPAASAVRLQRAERGRTGAGTIQTMAPHGCSRLDVCWCRPVCAVMASSPARRCLAVALVSHDAC